MGGVAVRREVVCEWGEGLSVPEAATGVIQIQHGIESVGATGVQFAFTARTGFETGHDTVRTSWFEYIDTEMLLENGMHSNCTHHSSSRTQGQSNYVIALLDPRRWSQFEV